MKFTKNAIFILLLALMTTLLAGCKPDAYDSNGRAINLSDYRGKWVVINYWATWCSPCITEIPVLNQLAQYYPKHVVVLGVNSDNLDNSILNKLMHDYHVKYFFLNQFPINRWGGKESSSIPVTYLINPNGKLVATLHGPVTLENFQTLMQLPPIMYQ